MGYSLAQNLVSNGYTITATDANLAVIEKIQKETLHGLKTAPSIELVCKMVISPKLILLSIPAGYIDDCIEQLIKHLNAGDIVADLGNSLYTSSIARSQKLERKNIYFLDVGVSGGPSAARTGPAIMAGGSEIAWKKSKTIFEKIAAKTDGTKSCVFFGNAGMGHFIKMVHNGIEYALMQTLAEVSNVLRQLFGFNNLEQSKVFQNIDELYTSSHLLKITAEILRAQDEDKNYLLNDVESAIGQNGTGSWAVQASLELDTPIPAIYMAVATRQLSKTYKFLAYTDTTKAEKKPLKSFALEQHTLADVIFFNFTCSLYQGLKLINAANAISNAPIELEGVFKSWRSGSIIRGEFIENFSNKCQNFKDMNTSLLQELIKERLTSGLTTIRNFNTSANNNGIPTPVLAANLSYFDLIFMPHNVGEILQLQRSYFGQHTIRHKHSGKEIIPPWKTHG